MQKLMGTQTQANLMHAIARKSQNYLLFSAYAEIARHEGIDQAQALFLSKCDVESQQARLLYDHLIKQLDPIDDGFEDWSAFFSQLTQISYQEGFADIGLMYQVLLAGSK